MSLTIAIATRGRPDLLKYTLENTLPNITLESTKILVCIDRDDPATLRRMGELPQDSRIKYSVQVREDSRGEKYDRALIEAPADVYLPAVDCAPLLTKRFDEILTDKALLFPDGVGVIHLPYQGRGTFPPVLQAMTAGFVENMGYIYSHEYPFWFIDHEIHDIGRLIGRYFCANIDVPAYKTRPEKTIRLRDVEFWATYYDLMALERRAKARAIIQGDDFLTPDWIKADLLEDYQWIENGSWQINEHVRKNAATIEQQRGEAGPPDEGYIRAKARAEQKLSKYLNDLKAAA